MPGDKLRTKRLEWLLIIALFLAAAALHFVVGHFSKQLATYADEWYYYSIADSLWAGRGIEVQGDAISFQKVGYSLVLSPLFSVQDPAQRISLIGCLNSLLLMSSVFPVWLIGQELGLRKGYRWLVLAAVCLLPENLITVTFMSENLYYPLVFWSVWLWLAAGRTKKCQLSLLGGMIGCFAYVVKEAFLALSAAFILLDFIRLLRTWKKDRSFNRQQALCLLTYVLSFFGLMIAVRFVFFSSMQYSYHGQLSFAVLTDWNKIKYLFYTILLYIVTTLCSVFIVPFTFSLASRFRMEENTRRFLDFILLYISITVVFIAYTISVPEESGKSIPRFHLRYYAPALILILAAFARSVQEKPGENIKRIFRRFTLLSAGALLLVFFLFKGNHYGSGVDQFSLSSFDEVYWTFFGRGEPATGKWILIASLAAVIFFSLLLIWRKHLQVAALLYTIVMVFIMAADWTVVIPRLKEVYKTYPELIDEVRAVNAAMADAPEDSILLILADNKVDPGIRHCIDTYLEVPGKVVGSVYVDQSSTLTEDESIDQPDRVDYLLVGGRSLTGRYTFPGCEPIPIGTDSRIRFFRHETSDPVRLTFNTDAILTEASTWDEPMEVRFYGEDYNANFVVKEGVYGPEDGFSWTEGHEIVFEVQASQVYDTVMVELDVGNPFNGPQPFEVWHNDENVYSSEVFEPDNFLFALHPTGTTLSFSIRLPDAVQVNQVLPESDDGRCVAIQMQRMTFWVEEDPQL